MSAMEEFTKLKRIKNELLEYVWSVEGKLIDGLRLFSGNGNRTSEYNLSEAEKDVLVQAMNHIERLGGDISYNSSRIVAASLRQVLIHYCDHKLKRLAKQAQEEAKAVLEITNNA